MDDHDRTDDTFSLPTASHGAPTPTPAGSTEAAPAPAAATPAAPARRPVGLGAKIAAVAAAVVVTAGGTAVALTASGSSSASATGGAPSGQAGQAGGPQGTTAGGAGGGSGGMGFSPTAYHLSGTITAISSSTVTIRTTSGTTAYDVTGSTHLMTDNASASSLSSFAVGDAVVGSTTTNQGTTLNDLVSGMGGQGGTGGGAGGPGGAGTDPGTTTS